ncbi:hypothetical protein K488DRAFT_40407 [Vararia minispora EC-137]|uniref:Uncharacterized protein n=1 Tax=Vararia minispora EC-137 TaxID=1314806 RepID=A0ACB8QY83_9AGAM|nr:hypothetical protein K488DRAFT_40407 [Vararia minispora EC-137]
MKYAALLSGGKDSCYNLLHCFKNGHQLIVAASLGPEQGKEELDSYMYQTVGQDAIELVAQALGVPLIRRVIRGTAIEQGAEYGERKALPDDQNIIVGDETEDMYALLLDVKSRFPEVEAVSVGAILSNYQRVRVEHVCRRLSLTPLCYLWQRDQAELLSEIIDAGLEAILIKVAGIGLKTDHLGLNLSEVRPTLTTLNNLYGLHVCGEGGEYETFTLDSPLFQRRIRLLETERVVLADDKFATVAYLRIKNATLEAKDTPTTFDVPVPPLLSPSYEALVGYVRGACVDASPGAATQVVPTFSPNPVTGPTTRRMDKWVAFGNITSPIGPGEKVSLEDEVRSCFEILRSLLDQHSVQFSNIATMHVYIANMENFARVNEVYATFFGTSPPARACVAVDLPAACRLSLECIAYAENTRGDRRALHVQSMSYWAPANIGPYSQAIVVGDLVFVSGQIGMNPRSLSIPTPRSLPLEVALASQHVHRVVEVLRSSVGGGWMGSAMLNIFWYTRSVDALAVQSCTIIIQGSEVPSLHVVVKSLPKGALVEKQVLFHTGALTVAEHEENISSRTPFYDRGASIVHSPVSLD